MTYEQYEKECERIREENSDYLKMFEEDLVESGLKGKTIQRHLDNADLFLNDFLLREEPLTVEGGTGCMDSYFYFFIHKCMWSTPASVKSTAASLKKFYKSMADHEVISREDVQFVNEELKEGVPRWQEECEAFNDWDEDMDDDLW